MKSRELHEKKIRQWFDTVTSEGNTVRSIRSLAEIRKRDSSLLFALLEIDAQTPEETPLPRIVFIRGHATVVVPLLRNVKTGEERFLMVNQRRVGNGRMCLEFPAGMLDEQTDRPREVAKKELLEETGLEISDHELFVLNDTPLSSSAGASDEAVYFFGCIKEVDDETYRSFKNKACGNDEEHEFITVELVNPEHVTSRTTSLQAVAGLLLFDRYRKDHHT